MYVKPPAAPAVQPRETSEALGLLAYLSFEHATAHAVAEHFETIQLLVRKACEECSRSASEQELIALGSLAQLSLMSPLVSARAVEAGILPPLAQCLVAPLPPAAQHALAIITEASGTDAHVPGVLEAGLLPGMVNALQSSSETIQVSAATGVGRLAVSAAGRAAASETAVVGALLGLTGSAASTYLRLKALSTLDSLLRFSPKNCQAFFAEGGVALLTELIEDAEQDLRVSAAWTLSNLALGSGSDAQCLGETRLIEALVAAMSSPNEALAVHGTMCLFNLSCLEENRQLMVKAGCPAVAKHVAGQQGASSHVAAELSALLEVAG